MTSLDVAVVPDRPAGAAEEGAGSSAPTFKVRLDNFEGPFDLLLQLIGKHQLDVTEVALHRVTDDFIAHIRAMGSEWDLGQATEFLVIASTLLDLKAARLLPAADIDDEEDLALLEARDLLFARLLQYRAYKRVVQWITEQQAKASLSFPRAVTLEPRYVSVIPEVLLGITSEQFVKIAEAVFAPKKAPVISLAHLHAPVVSVKEQVAILRERIFLLGAATFRALCSDCATTMEIVGRFLAVLELYREGALSFQQLEPLGELHVRWVSLTDPDTKVEESSASPASTSLATDPGGNESVAEGER